MSLASALLDELSAEDLAELAERLAPLLADRLGGQQPSGSEWLRGADAIAAYLNCPRSRVYSLSSAGRLPVSATARHYSLERVNWMAGCAAVARSGRDQAA